MLRSLALILGATALFALAGCDCSTCGRGDQKPAAGQPAEAKACPVGCTKPCCAKPATAADAK